MNSTKIFDFLLKDNFFLKDTFLLVKKAFMLLFAALLYDIISFSFTYKVSAMSSLIEIGISSCWFAVTSHALYMTNIF